MDREIRGKLDTRAIATDHNRSRRQRQRTTDEERRGYWDIENSPLSSYERKFRDVVPEGHSFSSFIEEKLVAREGEAVGIELGGLGAFFKEFTPGLFKKTVGINLTDYRRDFHTDAHLQDEQRNHTVIEGDMLRHNTHMIVDTWLEDDKVDLIVKRMQGAEFHFPNDPFFLANEANKWYHRLGDNGIIFTQVSPGFWDIIKEWEIYVKETYPETLDVEVSPLPQIGNIFLQKLPNAPDDLPIFSVDEVRDIVQTKEAEGKPTVLHRIFAKEIPGESDE